MSPIVESYQTFLAETGSEVAAAILAIGAAGKAATNGQVRSVLTPPRVAKQLGVDPATVIGWIRSGQLKAANVGKGGQRPRYRIRPSDLDQFLKSRQPQPVMTKKRRAKQPAGEVEFFA